MAVDISAFSAQLLEHREVFPRARIAAQAVADFLPEARLPFICLPIQMTDKSGSRNPRLATCPFPDASASTGDGTLGILAEKGDALVFSGKELAREHYSHLHTRRTLTSLAYLPLRNQAELGAIEIVSFEGELTEGNLSALQPMSEVTAGALANAAAYEQERNSTLASITRITQLYDLEKVFGSTLELDQLLPIIASKFREVLECQAVNVWLLQGDESLELMQQAGVDPTVAEGMTQKPGEGVAGDVSNDGEAVLIESPDDERLVRRNEGVEEGAIFSLMGAPLIDKGALVGVVEAANRLDGAAFDEDELFALTTLTETAVGALHNASLLMAERKVEILEALVKTSGEITSTLDLDRVLQAIVNGPSSVIAYERAGIALDERGGIDLKAVSGVTQLNIDDPQYRGLRDILRWGVVLKEPLLVTQRGEEIDSDREETRAKFRQYFSETGDAGLPDCSPDR